MDLRLASSDRFEAHPPTNVPLPRGVFHGYEIGTTRTLCGQPLQELYLWPGLGWPEILAAEALCQGCRRVASPS